jgi:hypothetical protein
MASHLINKMNGGPKQGPPEPIATGALPYPRPAHPRHEQNVHFAPSTGGQEHTSVDVKHTVSEVCSAPDGDYMHLERACHDVHTSICVKTLQRH